MKKIMKKYTAAIIPCIFVLICFPPILLSSAAASDDAVCARVKIELLQELALERQAFNAHMRITNGLTNIQLENIGIAVKFSDEAGNSVFASSEPNNTEAIFFIQQPVLQGISTIDGSGAVQPSSVADINWLIIPARGAAKGVPHGTLYYVGATLSYTIGGEPYTVEVSPDYIFVKPMPEILLDYFLPSDIYGDDAFTPEIEPPVPFSLGARVSNTGAGTARSMKINSAQPKIVDNQQGLLIGFNIESSEVNGIPSDKTLQVNLGDIGPGSAASARWTMTCSLSGHFVEFTADYSHSNELGGELTSLLTAANTHFLIRDVLVDTPGKDSIRDFLAKDGDITRVYESEKIDTVVTDQSVSSVLSGSGNNYNLTSPMTTGFMYLRLQDPHSGSKGIREVTRSDGKRIKPENVWLSKSRNASNGWDHYFSIFDANTPGSYSVTFGEGTAQPGAPVLQFIPDKTVVEGNQVSFPVQASSPDGTIPALTVSTVPARAAFADQRTGTGLFGWTTAIGQAGQYNITFTASNGALQTSQRMTISVRSVNDTDGDGILDTWEMTYFGNLNLDGTGDFDRDGISDLKEFQRGSDPTKKDPNPDNSGPSIPRIQTPTDGSEVTTRQPQLIILNSTDLESDPVKYVFEVYSDKEMTNLAAGSADINAGAGTTTSWTVPSPLIDNAKYYWRVKASDGVLFSQWIYGSFFVNTANEPPGTFRVSSPRDNTSVDSRTPVLQVTNSKDSDGDKLTYLFRVFADSAMTALVAGSPIIPEGKDGTTSWTVNIRLNNGTRYYWKAVASDEHVASTESSSASFTVDTANVSPASPAIQSPSAGSETTLQELDLVVNNASGNPPTYFFELDKANTFDSAALRTSGATQSGSGTTAWHVGALEDHTLYFWRARASNGSAESPWVQGTFLVNTVNEAPSVPTMKNPGELSWTDTQTPTLALNPSKDPDNDRITYRFELYADEAMSNLIEWNDTDVPQRTVAPLVDNNWYYWRAQATDEHGAASGWTNVAAFFVKDNGVNDAPTITLLEPSTDVATAGGSVTIRWSGGDPDSAAELALYYSTESSGENGTLIASGLGTGPDNSFYLWNTSGVPDGAYHVYAVINDGNNVALSYAPGTVTVDRSALAVTASPVPGTYNSAQSVTLTANETSDIYYTFDGSDPTEASILYSVPFEVSETATLKAVAIDRAGNRSSIVTLAYVIERDIIVKVETSTQRKLAGLNVYAFTDTDSYTGKSAATDQNGIGRFNPADFTEGSYKFRADYLGSQFWSSVTSIPGTSEITITIDEAQTDITVSTAAGPAAGVTVYLFSGSGAYLGISGVTDASGHVSFALPVGLKFKFRADIMGSQYWSDTTTITGGATNVAVTAGGGTLQATVHKAPGSPMSGISTYLFNAAGGYLGLTQTTDASGITGFNVPAGNYKVRADYLSYPFWSAETPVNANTAVDLTIAHQDVNITVNSVYQGTTEAMQGVPVYLFNSSGGYLSQTLQTDANGRITFNLPERAFKVRADYLGMQFWSGEFTWQDAVVNVPMADAVITVAGSGQPQAGVLVYVFNADDAYLGVTASTNATGIVTFRLPAGTYKFRADYQNQQFWSAETVLAADDSKPVGVSVGGGAFMLTVLKGASDPLSGVACYAFTAGGSYLGMMGVTNGEGRAAFDLSSGSYKFRVDYRGYQFWSNVVIVPTTSVLSMLIEEADVRVNVTTAAGASAGVPVYLFSENGSYLGITGETDAAGMVTFSLPVGGNFKFRVNIMNSAYWSAVTSVSGGGAANDITVAAGGGILTVSVVKTQGNPMAGVNTYLFNASGGYLGLSQATDASGMVSSNVPAGNYKVRADYLSYPFWSAETAVNTNTAIDLTISHQDVNITVDSVYQGVSEAMKGVPVYLFNNADSYLGQNLRTDGSGRVTFNLPERAFKVRADYLGMQFWSNEFTWEDAVVNVPMADVVITVTGSGQPRAGVPVYVFNAADAYLGISASTNATGNATFRLPAGTYKFRTDYQSHQYWSVETALAADDSKTIGISTGGGSFTLTVLKGASNSLAGVACYAFTAGGSYLGMMGVTNGDGQAAFDLSSGSYKFRVDYRGYQFWSDLCNVPAENSATLTIPHQDVSITVTGVYQGTSGPFAGLNVYLFTLAESYLNQSLVTDANGRVVFNLPDAEYKVRVDYLDQHYWSSVFRSKDTVVTINQGRASIHVLRSGSNVEGATVYLFSESGAYLGRSAVTDAAGGASFILPDRPYKFRVDANGSQHWSQVISIESGVETRVEISID